MSESVVEALPQIGHPFQGGIYAGKTTHANAAHHLVVLPGEFNGTWSAAVAWAQEQGGELPSRVDLLILWQNVRDEFRSTWHWSGEQYAGYDEYAWVQHFGSGYQLFSHKDNGCRARAVRRFPIDQLTNSVISATA